MIRQEILNLKKSGIPIIVSISDVAASGGYWISANADEIWASPLSVTGSIGVFAVLPSFENALMDYGINFDGISTTNFNPSIISNPDEIVPIFVEKYKSTTIVNITVHLETCTENILNIQPVIAT